MARKKKPSGKPNRGPFAFRDLDRAIKADGWTLITGRGAGTKHPAYEHSAKRRKVSLDKKWTSIYANDPTFRSVASQAGLKPKQLLRLLNQ